MEKINVIAELMGITLAKIASMSGLDKEKAKSMTIEVAEIIAKYMTEKSLDKEIKDDLKGLAAREQL